MNFTYSFVFGSIEFVKVVIRNLRLSTKLQVKFQFYLLKGHLKNLETEQKDYLQYTKLIFMFIILIFGYFIGCMAVK